jgi:hypothetical protein
LIELRRFIASTLGFASASAWLCGAMAAFDPEPEPRCRLIPLQLPALGRTGFTRLAAAETRLAFTNRVPAEWLARNQIYEVGCGVALGDVTGDGRTDVYLCAIEGSNRLFRNLGAWVFEDVTFGAGVACTNQPSTGAVLADTDGDGDLDLLVNALGGGTRLFFNDGRGRFTEVTDSGLRREHGSTSLALADVNGDGALDLYVANYHTRTIKDSPAGLENIRAGYVNGEFVVTPPEQFLPLFLKSGGVSLFERGEVDRFYLGDGAGRFKEVSWTEGTFRDENDRPLKEPPRDWALMAAFHDLNGDRAPDLFVCNDFFHSPDRVWINDGHGRFKALPALALRNTSLSSMAVDFADINRDGWDDFLVLDMLSPSHERRHRQRASLIHLQTLRPLTDPRHRPEYPRNTLALNRGDGTYAEIAQYAGLDATDWSWSVAFLDVDLDGWEDVLITTGNLRDANDADLARQNMGRLGDARGAGRRAAFPMLETPCLAFRNHGDLTFEECGAAWGFATVGVSHGMALADLDNDGDLDVVVNHARQAAGVYRNESIAPRLAVRLRGRPANTRGIGARVTVRGGAVPLQTHEMISGGRYLSGDEAIRVFAAGSTTNRMRVEVSWRSGHLTTLNDVPANHLLEIEEPAGDPPRDSRTTPDLAPEETLTLFHDATADLPKWPPVEPEPPASASQPLVSRTLTRFPPGVAWFDADGDGWDDLTFSQPRGRPTVLYLNDQRGGFRPMRRQETNATSQSTLLGWRAPDGKIRLLAGTAAVGATGARVLQVALQTPEPMSSLHVPGADIGPLALGVIEDHPALFVGGRAPAGRYPAPVASRLYVYMDGQWTLHPATPGLTGVGSVNGAVWTDLDSDGTLELILACDWGPLHVFAIRGERVVSWTSALGLDRYHGWWTGVTTGDLDGDGRIDLLVGNWGRNTKFQRHRARTLQIHFGDFNEDGSIDSLESYFDADHGKYVPFTPLDALREILPGLSARFTLHAAYARAGIQEILGEHAARARHAEASWLETTVFLNRPAGFEPRPLPAVAQFAPAFGVVINDLDGDGNEDVFLAQNSFAVDPETSRYDAGRGLLLLGDGLGGLDPVPGQTSGIRLYGDQRGAAVSDFNHDGRVDLAVGQADGTLALFVNQGARPGLRIRLEGPPWNRAGIGAVLRLRTGKGWGPARVVHGGSGYWSQDGGVHLMGSRDEPEEVRVQWPGGRVTSTAVRPGQRELVVAYRD